MSNPVDALKKELDELKGDVTDQLKGVRSDLKDLTMALRELIRLDGDMKRQNDLLIRVAKQVDGLEIRVRTLEVNGSVNSTRIGFSERGMWLIFGGGLSVLTGVAVWLVK